MEEANNMKAFKSYAVKGGMDKEQIDVLLLLHRLIMNVKQIDLIIVKMLELRVIGRSYIGFKTTSENMKKLVEEMKLSLDMYENMGILEDFAEFISDKGIPTHTMKLLDRSIDIFSNDDDYLDKIDFNLLDDEIEDFIEFDGDYLFPLEAVLDTYVEEFEPTLHIKGQAVRIEL